MDPELRRAWTEIITAEDYEEHMASIGQAQADPRFSQPLSGYTRRMFRC
jgi:hypothetical protein